MATELCFFQRSEPFAHGKDGLPFGDGQRLPVSPERRLPLQNLFDWKGRFKGEVEKGPTIASPSHRIHRVDLIAFRTIISFHGSKPRRAKRIEPCGSTKFQINSNHPNPKQNLFGHLKLEFGYYLR